MNKAEITGSKLGVLIDKIIKELEEDRNPVNEEKKEKILTEVKNTKSEEPTFKEEQNRIIKYLKETTFEEPDKIKNYYKKNEIINWFRKQLYEDVLHHCIDCNIGWRYGSHNSHNCNYDNKPGKELRNLYKITIQEFEKLIEERPFIITPKRTEKDYRNKYCLECLTKIEKKTINLNKEPEQNEQMETGNETDQETKMELENIRKEMEMEKYIEEKPAKITSKKRLQNTIQWHGETEEGYESNDEFRYEIQ
ncbi:3285_t:CDS:2, partial [Dentiscutata heterogama]